MDYLDLIQKQKQNKTAVVANGITYTYGDLVAEAQNIRGNINKKQQYTFIYAEKIIDQLIQFLAYSGTGCVPVIATKDSKNQKFTVDDIPPTACMGVMTSGSTTGKSKLFWRSYDSWADFFPVQNKIFGIDGDSVIFCQGSLAFTGNLNIYLSVLSVGGAIVCTEKFLPKYWLDLIEIYKVNAMYLIPMKLMLLTRFFTGQNHTVKHIITGSQSMDRQDAFKLKCIYPQTEIILYYGASELNYITYIKDTEMTTDRTLVGRVFPNVEIAVKNEEIFVKTPYHVEGVILPFSLKDKGYMDNKGILHFLGRKDDICNINGLKISAGKVEQALMKVLSINEVAVTVLRKNECSILTAFIAGEKKYSRQKIIQLLKVYLADFEIPKQFIYVKSLPKNESGKTDKLKLSKISIYRSFFF